ncbi:23S rRNA (adenine(2030)-N(6))-methyltransferase RlmJ [Arenibaculum sp.]|jgi:23S rRNA (adenine2030-N6)-methyltransferase|uniref:23S rRNA (adenine(2030)-N(6))-methyltransferase RlmJ n=1 Tax=Arenibaculum sp. TaxID=2865862 RepID=UPI002E10560B|nr:23S rRNA (adenine(2030)-N(6))-methyltransferase RlmJ [Arenibaculum sp.]
MNYRHAFHAGNFADVMKHAVLALILRHLGAKPAPYCVLDTHAGTGRYDLASGPSTRTGEAERGIVRLMRERAALPPDLSPYLEAVEALNAGGGLRHYPGSPRLARALMRPQDRLVLAELHPEDAAALKREFAHDRQAAVHHMDGYLALKAHLPPAERRGLVLVDPPFETPDEFDQLVAGLALAHRRWPAGIKALWYPIKDRPAVWRFHDALEASGVPRILLAELTIHREDTHQRLNGSGMVLVNPPWRLDGTLATVLPALHAALGAEEGGARVEWLVPEQAAPTP